MAEPDQPTAQSILCSLLLTHTHYALHPSLASLRATLDSADARLSAQTDDAQLKLALREVVRHRREVVGEVEERVRRFRLLPKERKGDVKDDESEEEADAPSSAVPLADVLALLSAEEARLNAALEHTEKELQKTKGELEASVRRIERLELPQGDLPQHVEAKLGGVEDGVQEMRRRVEGVNAKAVGDGL